MRREDLYLNDIIEAVDYIGAFIAGADFEAFLKSEMIRSAVVQKLAIIGEAAARLPEGLKTRHPEVPWPQIVLSETSSFTPTLGPTGTKFGGRQGIAARC